jgi:hypothetical protein
MIMKWLFRGWLHRMIENPTVAILSFGATRPIGVRSKVLPRHAIFCDLEPGSAVVMSGHAQERFEHQIPKLPQIVGPRISVVFRTKRVQAEEAPVKQKPAKSAQAET